MSLTRAERQDIKSLLTKKGRKQHHMFSAEGVRLLEAALQHKVRPARLYFATSLLTDRGEDLIRAFRDRNVGVTEISPRQLESLAETEAPQGVLGVFALPPTDLAKLYRNDCRKLLLCENINDPGNFGTLIRSALAFSMDLVVAIGSTCEPYAPKVVRSTAGALFGMRIAVTEWDDLRALLEKNGISLIAADLGGDDNMERVTSLAAANPLALAVGSETHGLSKEILSRADIRVRIPHSKAVESLNVAVAGSILMRELYHSAH